MKATRYNLLYPVALQPKWGPTQSFTRPVALEDAGYGISANPDSSEHNYLFQVNSLWNKYMDENTRQLQPDVVVGLLAEARVTNDETDFVAACLAGYKVLFVSGIVFTAARTLVNQIEIGMDSPDASIDLDTFDFTLKEVSGYIGITTNGGKLVLDGVTHGLIVRGSVAVVEGSNFSGSYSLNGIWNNEDKIVDHRVGTAAQVAAGEATVKYVSASTEFQDASGNTVVFSAGDRLGWVGLDTLTADIDLSGIDGIAHETFYGVVLSLGVYNLKLGSNHSGNINATGSGNLSATNSPELVVNNNRTQIIPEFDTDKSLVVGVQSSQTSLIACDSMRCTDDNNNGLLINDVDELFTLPALGNSGDDLADGLVSKASTYYGKWITYDYLGNIKRVFFPDNEGIADSDVANELVDSTATFSTDYANVAVENMIVYNMDTKDQIGVVSVDGANNITLAGDTFPNGDENYKIVVTKPPMAEGKVFYDRIGTSFYNSGGVFDNSYYTQGKERIKYDYDGNYTVSNFDSIESSSQVVWQDIDGEWYSEFRIHGDVTLPTGGESKTFVVSGVDWMTQAIVGANLDHSTTGDSHHFSSYTIGGDGFKIEFAAIPAVGADELEFFGVIRHNKKPTFVL